MGFSQPNAGHSQRTTPTPISAFPSPLQPPCFVECHPHEFNLRALLRAMAWDLGLSCFFPSSSRKPRVNKNRNLEQQQNKAWLLAESDGPELTAGVVDTHSVHSSFRFSFCSQVELETVAVGPSSDAAATILMVNLENGMEDSGDLEQRCRRIEILEKSVSPFALIRFTFAEILSATRHFSDGRVLGRGALSCVYRGRFGVLRTAVAIKRLEKGDKESPKAFCRELMIASSLHHPNVAPLIGFCMDAVEGFFLVYKYVSGGSLELHLHGDRTKGKKSCSMLAWSMRYKVALGISEAVEYLHYGTERCVVHRDIKPSNILLSSKKKPKLCDFGLASWTPAPSVPFLCKTVKGTFGYLAPEYFQHGKISDKTDVYALGVVLLELITGRKPIESKRSSGEENLVIWAKSLLQKGAGGIEKLLDPRLKDAPKSSTQIARMIEAAAACINSEESRRPRIGEIVAILRGKEEPVSSTNKKKPTFPSNGHGMDYVQLQRTKSEMSNHLALAMLGVEDDEYFYGN